MLQLVPSAMILLFLSLVLGVLLGAGWFVYGVARGIPYWRAGLPLACALAVYGVLLLAGSATSSERHVPLGSSLCFDDWCVSVTGVQAASAAGSERTVTADVRVFSEAKRVTQRGSGPRIFLIDDRRRWFEAMPSRLESTREFRPGHGSSQSGCGKADGSIGSCRSTRKARSTARRSTKCSPRASRGNGRVPPVVLDHRAQLGNVEVERLLRDAVGAVDRA